MFRRIVVPALVALGLLGPSVVPSALAQGPTPAPKSDKMSGGKMGSKKKKGPERGPDGKFLSKKKKGDDAPKADATPKPKRKKSEKSDKMGSDKKDDTTEAPKADATPKPRRKKSEKSDKMGSSKMGSSKSKVSNPTGEKPVWDANVKRWRLNGRFISEADALKMGGRK
jgi:hypothetical protein